MDGTHHDRDSDCIGHGCNFVLDRHARFGIVKTVSSDPNAPRHLNRLLGNIVKYMNDDSRGRIPRRKPVEETMPRKVCKVCLKPFDFITVKIKGERTVEGAVCPDCQKELDAGMIACCYANNPGAFIKPPPQLQDMAGQIMQVTREIWDEIKRQAAPKNGKPHAD